MQELKRQLNIIICVSAQARRLHTVNTRKRIIVKVHYD